MKTTRKLRVLIAEDDPNLRNRMGVAFCKDGHHVTLAGNGESALSVLRRRTFDLAILEYQLPFVTGPKALEKLKLENISAPHTVILTAERSADIVERILDSGATTFMVKPVEMADLLQHAREISVSKAPIARADEHAESALGGPSDHEEEGNGGSVVLMAEEQSVAAVEDRILQASNS